MQKFNVISRLFTAMTAMFKMGVVEDSPYGANAITSGELTEEEQALLDNPATIMDNGETVEVNVTTEDGDIEVKDGEPTDEEVLDDDGTEKAKPVEEQVTEADIDKGMKTQQEGIAKATEILTAKGVDVQAILSDYYAADGKISDENYAKLDGAGFPKSVVDAMVAGAVAQQGAFDAKVFELGGGKENWKAASAWAAKNAHASVDAFNKAYASGDIVTIAAVQKGLLADYKAATGTKNKILQGNRQGAPAPKNAVKGFANSNEMVKAMQDPRYNRDATYTKEVEAKVAAM